jgi:hypothetical protein
MPEAEVSAWRRLAMSRIASLTFEDVTVAGPLSVVKPFSPTFSPSFSSPRGGVFARDRHNGWETGPAGAVQYGRIQNTAITDRQ